MKRKPYLMLICLATLLPIASCRIPQKENQPMIQTFTLENNSGGRVKLTNFGATVMSIQVPDRSGKLGEVVLGYDEAHQYLKGNPYFGATIGRYGNRIARGRFELDGTQYQLALNNGPNHLHGGPQGFHNRIWNATTDPAAGKVTFTLESLDGDEGYPGTLKVKLQYTWTNDNELRIEYEATCDRKTVLNLTHHSFFNLKDGGASNILGHKLKIMASSFTPVDHTLIPTGEIKSVTGTPFDFRQAKPIGKDINQENQQLQYGKGYDHNFILDRNSSDLILAAQVTEPATGRKMEIYTTEPGLQFYSGNFLDRTDKGHDNTTYAHRTAFCLETQHYPDSPNHPNFPTTTLNPGKKYTQTTIYKFSTE